MAKLNYQQALNQALAQEMERDERVVVMGEDVAGGSGSPGEMDAWGGPLGVTKGLWGRFGDRVMDTPISESAFVGAAVGAAAEVPKELSRVLPIQPTVPADTNAVRCALGGSRCGVVQRTTRL